MKKIISVFICAFIVASMMSACSSNKGLSDITVKSGGLSTVTASSFSDKINALAPEKYTAVADNSSFTLYADLSTGDFSVYSKKDKVYHYSGQWAALDENNPISELNFGRVKTDLVSLIAINYVQLSTIAGTAVPFYQNSYAYCVIDNHVTVEQIKDGYRATFFFSDIEAYVPVEITLRDDGINARIVGEGIKSGDDYLVTSVSLLPGFMAGYEKHKGYCFVPSGCGALIPLNSGRGDTTSFDEAVYGNDTALSRQEYEGEPANVLVPVYGIKDGDFAVCAIITEGDVYARIKSNANSSTTCYTTVFSEYTTAVIEKTTLFESNFENQRIIYGAEQREAFTDFSVDYHFLYGGKANYAGMADTYRNHLSLNADVSAPKLAITLYGAAYKKSSFMGIPYSKDIALTSFDDVVDILSDFGDTKPVVNLIGFNGTGIDNIKIKSKLSPASVLGGKSGFGRLDDYLKKNSIEAYYEMNFITFKKSGGGYSVYSDVCRSIFNTRTPIYKFMRSTYVPVNNEDPSYLTVPSGVYSAAEEFSGTFDSSMGVSYTGLGTSLYSDFKGGGNRRITLEIFNKLFDTSNKNNKLALEGANAYTYPYLNRIFSVPMTSDGNVLFDRDIPFLQMVLHGLKSYSAEYETDILDCIAFGADPAYCGIKNDDGQLFETTFNWLYGTTYTNWASKAKSDFSKYDSVYSKLYDQKLVDYYIDGGVSKSVFENGTVIYVNRNTNDVVSDGVSVAARSFTVAGVKE